jgi:hypothetical protein
MSKSPLRQDAPSRDVPVVIRVPDAGLIKGCHILSGDYPGEAPVEMHREGTAIAVRIPTLLSSSMVVFTQ